jgi:phosphoenolpyruvate carboxykinase (ATP)
MYYFINGYTAKLAGTERGVTEPTPTFSACFGYPRHHRRDPLRRHRQGSDQDDPVLRLRGPDRAAGVATNILDPRDTYADKAEWDQGQGSGLPFVKNFAKYEGNEEGKKLVSAGPKA